MRSMLLLPVLMILLNTSFAETPQAIDAMNNPSKHAWNLFLMLNHPADLSAGRGVRDESKVIGDEGLTVWETWKSAGTEVFLPNGTSPGPWDEHEETPFNQFKKEFDLPKFLTIRALASGMTLQEVTDPHILLEEVEPDGVFQNGGGETRMNRATFEFIVANNLFNVEGQEKLFIDISSGARENLSFPNDSVEIKAMWIPLTVEDVASGRAAHYHQGKDANGNLFGLVTLHIITKDVPNWFWCSFRHIEGPEPKIPSVDNFGRPSLLDTTKWRYYELSGTQTDFTDTIGTPNLLSDPHIEAGFERSSCISCHAMSSIGAPSSFPQGDRLSFTGIGDGDLGTPIGVPESSFFLDNSGKLKYVQLDFVFSLAFRAQRSIQEVSQTTRHTVEIVDFKYVPETISIRPGDEIVFRNSGSHRHTATRVDEVPFDTGVIEPGAESPPVKFDKNIVDGDFEYFCSPHPFMKGRIVIASP